MPFNPMDDWRRRTMMGGGGDLFGGSTPGVPGGGGGWAPAVRPMGGQAFGGNRPIARKLANTSEPDDEESQSPRGGNPGALMARFGGWPSGMMFSLLGGGGGGGNGGGGNGGGNGDGNDGNGKWDITPWGDPNYRIPALGRGPLYGPKHKRYIRGLI